MGLIYERYSRRKFKGFQTKVRKHLPNLAKRIFALNSPSLEKTLGWVIIWTNCNYTPKGTAERIVTEIIVEHLFNDTILAERG